VICDESEGGDCDEVICVDEVNHFMRYINYYVLRPTNQSRDAINCVFIVTCTATVLSSKARRCFDRSTSALVTRYTSNTSSIYAA